MKTLVVIYRWAAVGAIVAITVSAVILAWISHYGRQRLAEVQRELVAKGEKLTFGELVEAPVPDALNVFEDPIWRPEEHSVGSGETRFSATPLSLADTPLTAEEFANGVSLFGSDAVDWESASASRLTVSAEAIQSVGSHGITQDQVLWLLSIVRPFDPLIARIERLLDRPVAQFRDHNDPLEREVYQYGGGLTLVKRVLTLRAAANLALGNADKAASDICTMAELFIKTKGETVLLMEMLRLNLVAGLESIIRDGVDRRSWSIENLEAFEHLLRQIDLIAGMARAFRAERGIFNQVFEDYQMQRREIAQVAMPGRFLNQPFQQIVFPLYLEVWGAADQANLNRDIQCVVELLDASSVAPFQEYAIRKIIKPNDSWLLRDNWFYMLGGNVFIAAEYQVTVDQTRIACALERYRLIHRTYPDRLEALVPGFLQAVPDDRFSGRPMRYLLLDSSRFELLARDGEETIRWTNFQAE